MEKVFIDPEEDGNASTDEEEEDAEDTEPQGSRPKKARKAEPQEAPCLYCGRVFKGEKGVLRHEKFCQKKKDMMG